MSFNVEKSPRAMATEALRWLAAAAFCGVFAAVYEHFSHGVYSGYMLYMFLFPLLLGAVPSLAFALSRWAVPSPACRTLWTCGTATLTVGSCVSGVLYIYGTTSDLASYYWIAGGALLAIAAVIYLVRGRYE